MGYAVATLRDDFEDGARAAAWSESLESGSATLSESAGRATITLPSSTAGTHTAYYATPYSSYDITGDGCYINIQTMVATGVAAIAFFDIILDANNYLEWTQTLNTIKARKIVAGVATDLFSATWSSTTYKYLRIREAGGTIFFDSSTNGTSWTNRASIVGLPFAVTDLRIAFGAQCGNVASPGTFKIEDFNLILPALSTTWRWIQKRWPLTERFRVTTLAIDTANTVQGYIVTADTVDSSNAPSGNVRYWSGPLKAGRELTEQATQTAAQAMAVNFPVDGRLDLPEIVEGRCIRTNMRSIDGASFIMREDYSRRLIQSDDIEAESIRAINIAASAITVDKLDATLTITGKTIQTAYSGARVALSGDPFGGIIGYGSADTYNPLDGTGTYQLLWKLLDGKLYAGAGNTVLDANGVSVIAGTSYADTLAYRLIDSGGAVVAGFGGTASGSAHGIVVKVPSIAGHISSYQTTLAAPSGKSVEWRVDMTNATNTLLFMAKIDVTGSKQTFVFDGGGLDVGNTGGTVADGQIRTSGNVALGDAINSVTRLRIKGASATSSDYALIVADGSGTAMFIVRNDNRMGFFGATEVAKPSVTGAKGGSAALGSLMTALSSLGLVSDGTGA